MVRCKHIWLLVEQGSAMFMECESCSAIVAVGWGSDSAWWLRILIWYSSSGRSPIGDYG